MCSFSANPERELANPNLIDLTMKKFVYGILLAWTACLASLKAGVGDGEKPAWTGQPLSLAQAVDLALVQNGTIRKGKSALEAQYGIVVQTRAIALPQLQAKGNYEYNDENETFNYPGAKTIHHQWNSSLQLTQNIYQGGNIQASLRTAKLTKEQALLNYQTVIADSLLQVRIAYYDVLRSEAQVTVEEASIKLLTQQLDDQKRRFDAGTVPRFSVLQAEVAAANERPKLIQARNSLRISKMNLVNLLGCNLSKQTLENVPMQLTDKLDDAEYAVELPVVVAKALENRSELAALRKGVGLASERVAGAKSGYKPSVQIFGGYGARSAQAISDDPSFTIHGASAGVQASWNIFDGFLTKGKVAEAKAGLSGAAVELDNAERNIDIEVRTDYSNLIEAWETLESQKKVQEEAEESLRLAKVRNEAGTGTQLDVLSAQTSLTQARSTQIQALHDYDVARARMERAIGVNFMQSNPR